MCAGQLTQSSKRRFKVKQEVDQSLTDRYEKESRGHDTRDKLTSHLMSHMLAKTTAKRLTVDLDILWLKPDRRRLLASFHRCRCVRSEKQTTGQRCARNGIDPALDKSCRRAVVAFFFVLKGSSDFCRISVEALFKFRM